MHHCFSLQNEHHQIPAATKNFNTQRTENKTTDVVIHQHSRKLLKMDILMSETRWQHNKWNKIASDIKLVFHSSTIAMMHGPINIRFLASSYPSDIGWNKTFQFYFKCKSFPHKVPFQLQKFSVRPAIYELRGRRIIRWSLKWQGIQKEWVEMKE